MARTNSTWRELLFGRSSKSRHTAGSRSRFARVRPLAPHGAARKARTAVRHACRLLGTRRDGRDDRVRYVWQRAQRHIGQWRPVDHRRQTRRRDRPGRQQPIRPGGRLQPAGQYVAAHRQHLGLCRYARRAGTRYRLQTGRLQQPGTPTASSSIRATGCTCTSTGRTMSSPAIRSSRPAAGTTLPSPTTARCPRPNA